MSRVASWINLLKDFHVVEAKIVHIALAACESLSRRGVTKVAPGYGVSWAEQAVMLRFFKRKLVRLARPTKR